MATIEVTGFDHYVLRCANIEATLAWYVDVLGLEPVRVEEWRAGEVFFPSVRICAESIIDLVPRNGEFTERNIDHVCLVATAASIDAIDADRTTFSVVDGPDTRYGAQGNGWSIYVLDPDDNVVELRTYDR